MKFKQPSLQRLLILATSLFALMAFLPRDWTTQSTGSFKIESIYVFNPYIYNTIFYASAVIAIYLLITISKKKLPTLHKTLLLLIPIVLYPASCTKSTLSSLGHWSYHGTISMPDGATYRFLDSSFLQGQRMAIAKLSDEGFFIHRFDVMVMSNGDSPRSYSHLIRHEDAQNTYGQLYYTADGYLIGIRHENKCFLAYHLLTNQAYGHGAVEDLSPFIMLNTDSRLNNEDVRSILESGVGERPGQPRLETVKAGLNHPNRKAREVAVKLLENTQTIASSPVYD